MCPKIRSTAIPAVSIVNMIVIIPPTIRPHARRCQSHAPPRIIRGKVKAKSSTQIGVLRPGGTDVFGYASGVLAASCSPIAEITFRKRAA
jgi:hypothetical protein